MTPLKRQADFDPNRYRPARILFDVLASCGDLPFGSIIALHGWPGSGKTSVALWLAGQLEIPIIHLDDFNCPDRRGFDESRMRISINDATRRGTVIIDGVCAARVCSPSVLVLLGQWPGSNKVPTLMPFIADYDPMDYHGSAYNYEVFQEF